MQRQTRLLLRAAKHLEHEAREYLAFGKEEPTEARFCGRRASMFFGMAYSLRQLAKTGIVPSVKDQQTAVRRSVASNV